MLYKRYIKRLLDIFLSVIALIVLSIPMLIVALLVRIKIGSPVLFRQKRIGKDEKEFMLLKFRTMLELRDENGVYLPDTERITKFGKFLRKTSIDELPSLINIIKGDMSIIGPRPLPARYLNRYNERQHRRHEVRPGLSSPSVVQGRNLLSWEDQFEQDVQYVEGISFWMDLKSIFKTVSIVFSGKGATSDDGDARCEFIGIADINDLKDPENNYMKLHK